MGDFNVKNFRRKLAEHYQKPSKVHSILRTTVLPSGCQEDLDQMYTPLSWVKEEQFPAGSLQKELSHYTELFTEKTKNGAVPKRILVQGETGIGKTTFVKRLLVDWSDLINAKMTEAEEQEDTLKKFNDDEGAIEDNEESCTDDEDMDEDREESTTSDENRDKDSGREDDDDAVKMEEKEQDALRMLDGGELASSKCSQDKTEDTEESSTDNESSNGDDNLTEDTEESFTDDEDMDEDIEDDVEMDEEQKETLRKFELVIAVNLKEVSECQTLEEVITGSYLSPKEDESLIDDLLCFIYENQDKVLLVLDGYNEYRMGIKTNSRTNSPIYSIFQGNDLSNCTILVTTRSSRAEELLGSADIYVKITGFNISNRNAFMRKMLDSETKMESVLEFIEVNNLEDLARVPLLSHFFCLLLKDEKMMEECYRRKARLYQAIVEHILQHGRRRDVILQISKLNDQYYEEILADIGKVALEGLLKGDPVLKYGQLTEKVRGEGNVTAGLFQLSNCARSLESMEMIPLIRDYLAAWYVTYRCVPEGNFGAIEQYARTLEDCLSLTKVFELICGLSHDGAVKVFQHLTSVRISDPTLNFPKIIADVRNETDVPLFDVTKRHEDFSDMVLLCFSEVQLRSELFRLCLDCTSGIVIVSPGQPLSLWIPEVKDLIRDDQSGVFVLAKYHSELKSPLSHVNDSLDFLECQDAPLKITKYSEVLKAADFLKKLLNVQCVDCFFRCILCFRNGQFQFYITDLVLCCDDHSRIFTETTPISNPSTSENLLSGRSCLKFLKSLIYSGNSHKILKDLGAIITDCTYLI